VAYRQAEAIWKRAGLQANLSAPTSKDARLDYARKQIQAMRRASKASGENPH